MEKTQAIYSPSYAWSNLQKSSYKRKVAAGQDAAISAKLSLTLLFPVRFKTMYTPFYPFLEEARFIALRYEALRHGYGKLIMAKRQQWPLPRESTNPNKEANATPFIDARYVLKPSTTLNREIRAPRKGTIHFRVEANQTFSVCVVTNHGHEVLQGPNPKDIKQEDLLFRQDSNGKVIEDRVTLPPGPSWFLIECSGDKEMNLRFQCFPP